MNRAASRVRCVVLLDGLAPFVLEPGGSHARDARTVAVVDDACERFERVASEGCGPGPVGRWQRRALRRSLRAAAPAGGDAVDLLGLGRNATADARACLVRTGATPASAEALEALIAGGARLAAVTTPARLLARLHRRHPVPRLFVARTGGDERHVLVVDGVPCFARTVVAGAGDTSVAVAESLEHLAGRYAAGRIDVAGIGLDDAALEASRALPHVGDVRTLSRADLATTLARRVVEGRGPPSVRRRVAHVPGLLPATAPGASGGEAGTTLTALRVAAALGACAAVAASGHALAAFVRTGEPAGWREAERERLEAHLDAELAALDALHESPFEAADRLARAEALDAGAPPGIDVLLTRVARALAGHEALRIDAIAWSMSVGGEREAAFADVSGLPVRSTGESSGRSVEGRAGIAVELAGRVSGAASVGAAERAVDAFVDALGGHPDIASTARLDSPLERAAEGQLVGEGSSAAAPVWRIRFTLTGPDGVREGES